MRSVLIFASVLCWLAGSAHAGSLTSVVDQRGRLILALDGEIAAGDGDALKLMLHGAEAAGHQVKEIHLNSRGGSLAVGAKIAAIVRRSGMKTVVEQDRLCASACFLVFAGGSARIAGPGARIGVHRASDDGADTEEARASTIDMVRFAGSLGVPGRILAKMGSVPPGGIYWLSGADLSAMKVALSGGPAPRPWPLASLRSP